MHELLLYSIIKQNIGRDEYALTIYLASKAEGNLTTGPRVMPSANTELLTPPLSCNKTKAFKK